MSGRTRSALWVAGLVLAATCLSSCVYFNTFYNAKKYFAQAERARAKYEAGVDEGNARNRATQHIALYDKAVRKASIVLEKYPESDLIDDAMFLAGRALYWQGDYQYAIRSFTDLEGNFPNSEYYDRSRLWRARCLVGLGRLDEARALYNVLLSEGGSIADQAGLHLGELAATEGDVHGAIGEYRAVLRTFPETRLAAQLWLRIGRQYMALGGPAQLDSSLVAFDRALDGSPPDSVRYRARLDRGRVQYLQGYADEALATYRSLLSEGRFRRWEGETRILIGQYYRERGNLDAALSEFERVRDDFPQTAVSAMALFETGRLYLQDDGDRGRAEEYFAEVADEKRGSVADSLARDMLQTGAELDGLIEQVWLADSTAAALRIDALRAAARRDSIAATTADSSVASGASTAAADSVAAAGPTAGPVAGGSAERAPTAAPEPAAVPVPAPAPGQNLPPALRGYRVDVDSSGHWTPLVARPGEDDAGTNGAGKRQRARPATRVGGGQITLEEQLFAVAEIYRDRLAMPDSAAVFYQAIVDRYPESPERPRALYSLAWIHQELHGDREGARPYLERLVAEYGATAHANAARRLLGLPLERTAQEEAMAVYREIEQARQAHRGTPSTWIDRLDSLSHGYPATAAAARAAFLAAWSTENDLGDSVAAATRYDSVAARFPRSTYADIVERRRKAQREGVLAKMERELHTLGQGLRMEERLTLVAAEPDSVDSTALARQKLGFALRAHRHGHYQRATELYQASLDEQQGNNGNARAGLGDVAWRQGYYEEAIDDMRRSLKERASSLLPYYRLFSYHVLEGQVDSANNYLRQLARRDRDNPSVRDVVDLYPKIASAEPEDLDLDLLESLQIEPRDEDLRLDPALVGVAEAPMVRSSEPAVYPEGQTDSASASVVVDVLIGRDGAPSQVEVFDGEEPFATAARTAVEAYRFYPAEDRRQQPVPVWVEVTIPFVPPKPEGDDEAEAADAGAASRSPLEAPTPPATRVE